MTTSTQPTHIKINLWLFLFTKDRRGSMKSCLPFLLVQIQCDDSLWRPQCLPCPPRSKQQDYCMSHQIPADAAGTKQVVCTGCGLVRWRQPSVKMWTCGRVTKHHEILLMFPAWSSIFPGGSSPSWPTPAKFVWFCRVMGLCKCMVNFKPGKPAENHVLSHTPDWTAIHCRCLFYYHAVILVAVVY